MNLTMHLNGKKLFLSYKIFSSYLFYPISNVRCSTYKNTLFLPKTNFPHKVNPSNRRERDRLVENSMNFEELYEWQRSQDRKYEFILHDGPPYANGDVHIGHAVNKVLKDITVRFKVLQGYKIHFIPGWDCHGLPIELKVLKECDIQNSKADLIVRKKAYEFSQKTKERQLLSFKEWGILADWKNNYFTCHPSYVIKQLQVFQDLYDKGIVYQDHKPVFWSPFNKTSLAEAELEYNSSHVSPSIYIKFGVTKYPDFITTVLKPQCSLNALIWTTTPWTLPANQAVCYSADKKYCIVMCKNSHDYYIIAEEMSSLLASTLKTEFVSIYSFEGSCLKDFRYSHPVYKDRECLMFPAHHVTMTKGTGLVHTAPNHGLDDYIAAMKQNLPLDICLVDDNGCFTKDAGLELSGKEVLSEGTKHIINMLNQDIVFLEDYVHSYPYDWRSKTPVIIKSSHQWFINVQEFQMQAINCLQNVKVFPEHLKSAFLNQLKSAPQWCISRQRYWGVPIPAFYQSGSKTPIVHRLLTDHLCQLIQKHGIHCWWEMDAKDLLPSSLIKKCGLQDGIYERGSDILDIWLDSGISWKNVLPEPCVSDVCIEGVDQIRGWFNSSLMTSVALKGKAPYKSLVFHGFTTDAEGRKMSKSEGNVISPVDIINGSKKGKVPAYGIDVLRWWIASHACQHENIPVKMQIFEECSQSINKLRNMLKFLLGSLSDFNSNEDIISPLKMRPLDVYMLHLLKSFSKKVQEDYNNFQYKNVTKSIVNFSTNEVSSFYFHLIKDRLYCDQKDSTERLSCQTVLYYVLNSLVQSIGAICPHLAEEVMMHHPNKEFMAQGLFRSSLPSLDNFLADIVNPYCVELANQIRHAILKADIKTLNLHALIIGSGAVAEALDDLNNHVSGDSGCTEFFQVSSLAFSKEISLSIPETAEIIKGQMKCSTGTLESFTVILQESKLEKCPRCRRYSSLMPSTLCIRCQDIVNSDFIATSRI